MFLEVDSQLSLFALSSYSQLPSHTTVLVGHLSKCWLQPVSSEHSVVVMLNHVQIHLYPGWTTLSCSTSQNCPVFPTLCPFSSSSLPHRRTHSTYNTLAPVSPRALPFWWKLVQSTKLSAITNITRHLLLLAFLPTQQYHPFLPWFPLAPPRIP